jgi:hypothetical protein
MAEASGIDRELRRPRSHRSGITLLMKLPSRRGQFFGNLRVALGPAGKRLPLERELGRVSLREIGASALLHAGVLAVLLVLPGIRRSLPAVAEEKAPDYILIYRAAKSLPSMDDADGSPGDKRRAPGSREAFHSDQTVQVSQAAPLVPSVVEPKLPLPVMDTTATLLPLPAIPSPPAPVLAAPVEFIRRESKISWPDRLNEASAVDASHLQLAQGAVSTLFPASISAVAKLASESKIVLESAPRLAITKSPTVDVAGNPVPDLQMVPLTPVPALPPAENTNRGDAPAVTPQQVVVSAIPGEFVGVPVDGKLGSLALSPKGHAHPVIGRQGSDNSTTGGAGAKISGAGSGVIPAANGGTSPAAPSGIGKGGTPAVPGVVVRGGVVSLESFGPKAVPRQKSDATAAEAARKAAPITVIATSRSGGGLNAYGAFKNRTVYTIYIDTTAGQVVLQFAAPSSIAYNASLTPPDPLLTDMPSADSGRGVVFTGVLDTTGHLQNIRVIEGTATSPAMEEALRRWRFHPVLNGNQPVAVDALIGIGMGVR